MSDLTGVNCLKIPLNDKRVYSLFTTDDALNLMHKYIQKIMVQVVYLNLVQILLDKCYEKPILILLEIY